ncbi:MAG: hypothetical protein J6K97_00615 [Clostridia bacterium]|nr:hypothetical protein [Clostridia bacterium]
MSSKMRSYIISFSIIAAALVLLLVFLLLPKRKSEPIIPLTCSVEDVTINVGESVTEFLQISNENASVSFEVDKEGIISIDKDKIVGLAKGETSVTVKIEFQGEKIDSSFNVTVLDANIVENGYRIEFNSILNCEINENNIKINGDVAQFSFLVYDLDGTTIENPQVSFVVPENVTLVCDFGVCQLLATENCQIKLVFAALNFETLLNIIV